MNYGLAELIDLPQLKKLMESLYQATGINHALIDNDGVVHTAVGWQEICTDYHRVNPETCAKCQESDRQIQRQLRDAPYVGYRCPQGLVDYATPVLIEGEHIANVFTGQMFHEPPDIEFFRSQAKRYGFDEEGYLAALGKVPIIPEEKIRGVMAFQVQLAQMLASEGLARLRQQEAEHRLEAVNRGLEQRSRELEVANRELEEFSYSVSHDLRTPLRAITGFGRILEDDYGSRLDDEGRRLVGVIRDNATRMGELIDAIIGFLRVGRRPVQGAAIDMAALTAEVWAELLAACPDRRLRFIVGDLPPAQGDRVLVRQALSHLLANAVKFTAARAEAVIEVGATPNGRENAYYVKDNGVGFDMQYRDKLFRVFERLHSPGEFQGAGIGLATVKRIVVRLGGRVWAEGKLGEGATVYFTLPKKENE
jgi:signal transduction histidine kinase